MICATILSVIVRRKLLLLLVHFQLECGSIKCRLQKISKGTPSISNKFLKPALNIASPYIVMAITAKTKNPKVGQATTLCEIISNKIIIMKMSTCIRDVNDDDLVKKCCRCGIVKLKSNFHK